ncbi:ATP-binding protein [Myxococcus sp. AM010]|nr:ATP-binding protein [Myxococcus sp. AM010]
MDLYEVVRQRYERRSTVIAFNAFNRSIEEWSPLYCAPLMASAAMDRYLHHAHALVEVTPVSWSPTRCAKRVPRCRSHAPHTRRSSVSGSSS